MTELTLKQVSVRSASGHSTLLQNLSFSVEPGAKIGIVGASGAGKTTLLRLLNRLVDPHEGEILWQGKPLTQFLVPQLRQQIMLVPQEPRLLGMTVAQTLAYPLELQCVPSTQIQPQVDLWCQRLGVPEDWRSRHEMELSVGQRQWVCLTRALISQPQILLLDEPTSSLDTGRIDQLVQVLKTLDCTLLIASHQLTMVQRLCDRILWLDRGQLKQDRVTDAIDWQEIKAVLAENTAQVSSAEWDSSS